jgi:hypothetical protein
VAITVIAVNQVFHPSDFGDNMQTITKVHKVAAFTAGGGRQSGRRDDTRRVAGGACHAAHCCRDGLFGNRVCRAAGDGWRVRYFSPDGEVAFCGHATIALGAVLAQQNGDGIFPLTTNHAR